MKQDKESLEHLESEIMTQFKGLTFTTQLLRELLNMLSITIRRNEISGDVELVGYPVCWSKENAENNMPVLLLDILKSAKVKSATKMAVCDALDVISDENRFNPIRDILQSYRWDEVNRMPVIYEILGLEGTFSMNLIWKWFQQCVAMALNDEILPYGADGSIVLKGGQGIGKTSFFREIIPKPLRYLFKEGAEIDPKNKDTIIQATSHWICELGELDRTTKRDQASLKAFITANFDQYRTPYARKAIKRPRRTSFCGTVNPDYYLTDDTGNRRWWTIPVEKIDIERLFNLSDDWLAQLWVQAYDEWRENPQGFRLSGTERMWLGKVNRQFEKPLRYELEVRALLDFTLPVDMWEWFMPFEIAKKITPTPPAENIGRVLTKLSGEEETIEKKRTMYGWQYKLPINMYVVPP